MTTLVNFVNEIVIGGVKMSLSHLIKHKDLWYFCLKVYRKRQLCNAKMLYNMTDILLNVFTGIYINIIFHDIINQCLSIISDTSG